MVFHRFSWVSCVFHEISWISRSEGWRPVATCGGIILALKKKFRILEARIFDIRVLEARGLAGLAGFAGRGMEQRSLARSMLWRDRRINIPRCLPDHMSPDNGYKNITKGSVLKNLIPTNHFSF